MIVGGSIELRET